MLNPLMVGAGAAAVVGVGAGVGATKLTDRIAKQHPTGSDADGPARRLLLGTAGVGLVSAAAGMGVLATGRVHVGAALVGAGFGAMLGAFGGNIAYGVRHGIGVDTTVSDVLSGYDHNRNQQLDLDQQHWWSEPETIRTTTTRHEEDDGDVWYDTDIYSIDRLAYAADTNHDRHVVRGELAATIGRYDGDHDGRLKGPEARRFDDQLGERQIG